MKKIYFDQETAGCTSIYIRGAEVIPAGTTVSSMSIKDKNEEYQKFGEKYDIHFIFDDHIPELSFYTIPWIDIFAQDSKGGFFGMAGQLTDFDADAPVCYIDHEQNCFLLAENGKDFLQSVSDWKRNMAPARDIMFFTSRLEAVEKYEFVHSYDYILNQIAKKYQEILKDKLTGIYVHGSIAFGCFRWENSDIDFIVVVKDRLSLWEKEELIKVLFDFDGAAPQKGLEMSVVLDRFCYPFVYPTPFELHYSDAHQKKCRSNLREYCRKMHGTDKDLAAHFTVIRTVGKVVCGTEIPEVFGDVPGEAYLDSIQCDVENAVNEILENPVYIILNLCRVLAFMEENLVTSKKQGGQWGLQNLPKRYDTVIKKALQSYCGNGRFQEDKGMLKEFAEYMLDRIYQ